MMYTKFFCKDLVVSGGPHRLTKCSNSTLFYKLHTCKHRSLDGELAKSLKSLLEKPVLYGLVEVALGVKNVGDHDDQVLQA